MFTFQGVLPKQLPCFLQLWDQEINLALFEVKWASWEPWSLGQVVGMKRWGHSLLHPGMSQQHQHVLETGIVIEQLGKGSLGIKHSQATPEGPGSKQGQLCGCEKPGT